MICPRLRVAVVGVLLALALGGVLAGAAVAANGIEGLWATNSPFVYMLTTQLNNGTLVVALLTLVPASGADPAFTVWEFASGPVAGGASFAATLFDPTTPSDTSSSITLIFNLGASPPTVDITIIDRTQRTTFRGTKVL